MAAFWTTEPFLEKSDFKEIGRPIGRPFGRPQDNQEQGLVICRVLSKTGGKRVRFRFFTN